VSPEGILFTLGVLLTLGTGIFVASEFSLVSLERADLEARRDKGERWLGPVIGALKVTSTHLSSAQLGITLTTLLAGYTLEPAISSWLRPVLSGWGLPQGAIGPTAAVVAITLATILSMIIGELVPKNFAISVPRATAKLVIPLQVAFTAVFRPFVWVLNGTANAVLRAIGIEPREEISSARAADELRSLLARSAREGALEEDTAELLSRTLAFAERDASEVMTPRPRVAAIGQDESAATVITRARETGMSRFPVVGEDLDDIVGVVHIKQAIAVPRDRRDTVRVSALHTPPLRVPETMPLDSLLAALRGRGFQMAIVVDEYGGTAGVATLEDLVEEIVGEVADEHDRARADIIRRRDSVIFPGALRPDELLDRTSLEVPEDGPYETVAGWFLSELGRLARLGDTVARDDGVFRVERMDGRRIDRIRFTPSRTDGAER